MADGKPLNLPVFMGPHVFAREHNRTLCNAGVTELTMQHADDLTYTVLE